MGQEDRLQELFGFSFPDDFHLLWEFAKISRPESPTTAFDYMEDMALVGPFDVLAGRFDHETPRYNPCLHWRYDTDPPELVTIFIRIGGFFHDCYVVENPEEGPIGIAGHYQDDTISGSSASNLLPYLLEQSRDSLAEAEEDLKRSASDREQEYVDRDRRRHDQFEEFCSKNGVALPDESNRSDYPDVVKHCLQAPSLKLPGLPPDASGRQKLAAAIERLRWWRVRNQGWSRHTDALVEQALANLRHAGASDVEARLHLGRFLWHLYYMHRDAATQNAAFSLLDEAYRASDNAYLHHILVQHYEHRESPWLNVVNPG